MPMPMPLPRLSLLAGPTLAILVLAHLLPRPGAAEAAPPRSDPPLAPSSAFLEMLPEGEMKRRFILDCTGCHTFDERVAFPGGRARTAEEWAEAIRRMIDFAGAQSPFPVISDDHDADSTAVWLARYLRSMPPAAARPPAHAEVTEYAIPEGRDLPHDLALDADGRVVVTGMFTHRMYRLDPETGAFETVPIPVPNANPRSLEIDPHGNWWVLLGAPGRVARYDPRAARWTDWSIGMYAHEVRVDGAGRAWFNGHFSREPEVIGYVDTRGGGEARTFTVPAHPQAQTRGPIPYGLRIAPDGTVWGTELQGGRIVRFDPATERFRLYDMPTPWSGPRRIDVDAAGAVWIPAYAANRLVRFDPETERFHEYELPIPDALPYVVEVDRRRNVVWVGTGAADAVLAFHPGSERWEVHPLPTRGAMVRHLAIDARNGDVWAAYGASPGIPSKVARLRDSGAR